MISEPFYVKASLLEALFEFIGFDEYQQAGVMTLFISFCFYGIFRLMKKHDSYMVNDKVYTKIDNPCIYWSLLCIVGFIFMFLGFLGIYLIFNPFDGKGPLVPRI